MSHFIAGTWVNGRGRKLTSHQPVDETVLWQGYSGASKDITSAVAAAHAAQPAWAALDLFARIHYLKSYKALLSEEADDFAFELAQEVGKPLWEAKTEVQAMLAKIDASIAAYHERTGVKNDVQAGVNVMTRHRPHGVFVVLGPFNFPGHLPNGHIIPAILAGNSVVFKPSEQAPKIAERMMKLWERVGLPAGVINMVQGDVKTSQELISHPDIQGILFTGSYRTGKLIHEMMAGKPEIMLALEMGGNNPLIVDDISDIKAAVLTIIQSAYITSGQRCSCARRLILIKNDNSDVLLDALMNAIMQIRVGLPMDEPQPFMGSVISKKAGEALLKAQEALIKKGARALVPMQVLNENSALLSPGLIDVTGIPREDEELFGPLLQVIFVNSLDEAIKEANNTAFGLSAGILTDNKEAFEYYYERSRAGIVNWNKPTTGATALAPFGGIGHSGNHRPSAYYAADYCAYPVVTTYSEILEINGKLPQGLVL